MQTFTIKRNDLSRAIRFYPEAASASDFTGASVVFNMAQKPSGSVKVRRRPAIVSSDEDGTFFQYNWARGDTDTEGEFEAEFEVTLATGGVETYPNNRFIQVKILRDLA